MRNVNRRKGMFDTTPTPREAVTFPLKVAEYRSYEEAYPYRMWLTKDRSFAPYQPGEVMFVRHNDKVRVARVMMVFGHHLERRGHYIPKFRVQFITKDGNWSNNWVYIWPGDIYRAYHDAKTEQALTLPSEITQDWLKTA